MDEKAPEGGAGEIPASDVHEDIVSAVVEELKGIDNQKIDPPAEVIPQKEEVPPSQEEPKADPQVAKGLATIAKREKQLREAHQIRLAEISKKEAEIADKFKAAQSIEQLIEHARRDPAGFYRNVVKADKLSHFAEALYYDELGDAAPPEVKNRAGVIQTQREIAEVMRQATEAKRIAEEAKQAAEARAVEYETRTLMDQYRSQVRETMTQVADHLPHVRALVSKNPNQVVDALVALANSQVEQNPEGGVPEPKTLVEMLEQSIAKEFEPFKELYVARSKTAHPAHEKAGAPRTLSNANHTTVTQPKRVPQTDEERVAELVRDLEEGQHLANP